MPASRARVRGVASESAAGAGHVSADTTGTGSLRRCRTSGVATPAATAPHASRRRARVLRKAEQDNRRRRGRADGGGGAVVRTAVALGVHTDEAPDSARAFALRGAGVLRRRVGAGYGGSVVGRCQGF